MKMIKINGEMREFDGELHVTHDYRIFKKLAGNRLINSHTVLMLKKSMEHIGIIPMPIIVNENYEIIDGQHRTAAIELLGGAITYIIVPGLRLEDCIQLNGDQMKWKTIDFIQSYADLHYPQYETMTHYISANSDINPSVVIRAMCTHYSVSSVKDGRFVMGDISHGMKLLDIARTIKAHMKKNAGPATIDAINAMCKEGADLGLLKDSIEKYGMAYKKSSLGRSESAYAVLTEVYNTKRSTNRINFRAYLNAK